MRLLLDITTHELLRAIDGKSIAFGGKVTMPLPSQIDAAVRHRFNDLISEADIIVRKMAQDDHEAQVRNPNTIFGYEIQYQDAAYHALLTKATTLIQLVLGKSERGKELIVDLRSMESGSTATRTIQGVLNGLKDDYEAGMLDSLHEIIEANIVTDYMGQAEQLLGEGVPGNYDYVPAAVLAGAVLEDALRRLCQRQTPPIDTHKPDGSPKTLDPLITDLQKANVFNKAKADMLKSWAKTRNYAAHGEFTQFNRSEVEGMIAGVKNFIADYL
jgi:hypothetical protein